MLFLILVVLTSATFFPFHLSAQDDGGGDNNVSFDAEGWKRQNNVIPPSPDAASLGSYGNTGVNYYSGAANINIPLQGIGGKFLSAPLSLSYDASSVKVATVPSWVGLGWTLQAGGVITRAAQGMPDTWNFFDWDEEFSEFAGVLDPDNILYCNDQIRLRKFYNRVSAGDIDLQPDVFYFNFPGGSGSFIFDKNKNIIQRDRSDLIIEATASGDDFTTFVITTVNGTKYTFGSTAIERTEYTSDTNDGGDGAQELQPWTNPKHFKFNSSWYLISVTTPGGAESLSYDYSKENTSEPYSLPINVENDNSVNCSQDPVTSVWTCPTGAFGAGTPEESNPKIFNRQFLDSIILKIDGLKTERIRFSRDTVVIDPVSPTSGGFKLDNIIIERRWELTAWEPFIGYDFKYAGDDDGDLPNPTGRLTLESVKEIGPTENPPFEGTKPPYTFEYYSGALPSFISNAIDFWGYFNNEGGNDNLPVHKLVPTYSLYGLLLYSGANRKATGRTEGVLKSITYPTGGSTAFEYESHQANNLTDDLIDNFGTKVGGLRLKRMIDYDGLGGIALSRSFRYVTESGEESGILMNGPVYAKESSYTTERPPGVADDPNSGNFYGTRNNITLFAYNASSFGTIQGNHIGYSRVEEVIGGIGKNVYHYKVDPNGSGWDPTDGRLLKKEVFGKIGATVQVRDNPPTNLSLGRLDRKEIYEYGMASQDFNPPTFYVFRVESDDDQDNKIKLCKIAASSDPCDPAHQYEWRHTTGNYSNQPDCDEEHNFSTRFHHNIYGLSTTWTRPVTTTTTDYFYDAVSEDIIPFNPAVDGEVPDDWEDYFFGNGRSVTQVTNYEYDRPDLTLATAVSRNNSDGTIHRTEIEYFGNGDYDIRAIPEVITKKAGGEIIGGTRSVLNPRGWTLQIHEKLRGGSELLRATIGGYNNAGRPGTYQYMTFPQETFTWSNALLTNRTYGAWTWSFDYNEKRLLINQVDIDQQEVDFKYDAYNRLLTATAREGNVIKDYEYLYGGPNEVVQTTNYSDAPTQTVINQFDGLGRPLSTIVNGVTKNQVIYDGEGRVAKKTYLPGSFTTFINESSPLSRLLKEIYPDGNDVKFIHDAEDNHYVNTRINERDYPTITTTDLFGWQRKIEDAMGNVTSYTYDGRGNVESINSPAGGYSYDYDDRFRLVSKKVPGALPTTYAYDDANDLLCTSIDGNGNRMSTLYDIYGRETDVYHVVVDPDGADRGCGTAGQKVLSYQYDGAGINQDGNPIYTGKLSYREAALLGASGIATTSYALDDFGRIVGQGDGATIDGVGIGDGQTFTLNHADWTLKTEHTAAGYIQDFSYDNFGRMIYEATHGVVTEMEYNDKDQLLYKIFDGGLAREDYEYNERGWLTQINTLSTEVLTSEDLQVGKDPEFCQIPFGERETYVSQRTVTPAEFFELLCSGANVNVPEVDPCPTGGEETCYTTIYDNYSNELYINSGIFLSENEETINFLQTAKSACDREGGVLCIPYGFKIVGIEDHYGNLLNLNYDYNIINPYDMAVGCLPEMNINQEVDRLRSDVINWLDTNGYNYDEVNIEVIWGNENAPSSPIGSTRAVRLQFEILGSSNFRLGNVNLEYNLYCYDIKEGKVINDYSIVVTKPATIDEYLFYTCGPIRVNPGGALPANTSSGNTNGDYTDFENSIKQSQYSNEADLSKLYEIMTDDKHKFWLFENELTSIGNTKYRILKIIKINNAEQLFSIKDLNGEIFVTNLSGFFNHRGSKIYLSEVNPIINEGSSLGQTPGVATDGTTVPCPPTPSGCDEQSQQAQQNSLEAICTQTLALFDSGNIPTPYNVAMIQLCNGEITYVLETLLDQVVGNFQILNIFPIDGNELFIEVTSEEPFFAMEFDHQPNGNIEQIKWKVGDRATSIYDYSYDPIDRVTSAGFWEEYYLQETVSPPSGVPYVTQTLVQDFNNRYDAGFSYDGAGNVLEIFRNGVGYACGPEGMIDDLTLTYGGLDGQQLINVIDEAPDLGLRKRGFRPFPAANNPSSEYEYDDNGNMTRDPHKLLTIEYNFLNLPELMKKGAQDKLKTVYDATGRKWKKTSIIDILDIYEEPTGETYTESRAYINGVEFVGEGEVANKLASISATSSGRLAYQYDENGAPAGKRVEYYHNDHLGNIRLAFSDLDGDGAITVGDIYDPKNEITQERHYYPFGLTHNGPWFATVAPDNAYRYNGKELDEATGLYDYGARYYDPAVARWGQVDPLADQYAPYSPYNYVLGNPIRLIDPDGRSVDATYKIAEDGEISKVDDQVHYDADGNEVDILIAGDRLNTNKDGSIKNPHIQVGKNYLKGARELTVNKGGENELTGSVINFGENEEEARNVFEFAAENTDVEWSLFTTENNGLIRSMVTTSFEEDQERLGASLAKENASGLLYHDHSHPRSDKIIDTSQLRPSEGDKNFARAVRTINPDARVRVYFNGAYHDY
ncbi:RHS repeat-associated core domain-containing protein [Lewinella sp. LCG006]|uniref:RHS repeat-associated core domain-containing protein n=1 Tax=Lewinella sp. LCG006 TaxID=3231911 RepID=UPI00345F77D6